MHNFFNFFKKKRGRKKFTLYLRIYGSPEILEEENKNSNLTFFFFLTYNSDIKDFAFQYLVMVNQYPCWSESNPNNCAKLSIVIKYLDTLLWNVDQQSNLEN